MVDPSTTVASGITALLRIGQIVFELIAVEEQARDLLSSTNHVSTTVRRVQELRRRKSGQLQVDEKIWIDHVLDETERALANISALVEPVRVNLQTKAGVSLRRRTIFTFRDSPKVLTNMSALAIRQQALTTALTILTIREDRSARFYGAETHENAVRSTQPPQPPTYEESEFLNRRQTRPGGNSRMVAPLVAISEMDCESAVFELPLRPTGESPAVELLLPPTKISQPVALSLSSARGFPSNHAYNHEAWRPLSYEETGPSLYSDTLIIEPDNGPAQNLARDDFLAQEDKFFVGCGFPVSAEKIETGAQGHQHREFPPGHHRRPSGQKICGRSRSQKWLEEQAARQC